MQRRFPRRLEALAEVFGFAAEFCASTGVDGETRWTVDLVVEELFVNTVKHNPQGKGEVQVELERKDDVVQIGVADFDADRFDPTELGPPADLDKPLHERTPGGMGLHLVKQLADEVRYEYQDRTSRTIVTKKLG